MRLVGQWASESGCIISKKSDFKRKCNQSRGEPVILFAEA